MSVGSPPQLIAHIVFSFRIGGLENGIVNLINHMPAERYRHVIIALTDCDPGFSQRIVRDDVRWIALNKPPGHGVRVYLRLFRLLRELGPTIVHTRNLAALEMVVPAWAARVPVRIHGEHGWDTSDLFGLSRKYRLLRRIYAPFVTHYVALSSQIANYLQDTVGIAARRVTRICNGVDSQRFTRAEVRCVPTGAPAGFFEDGALIFGTVGRLQEVKDQLTLVRAFARWQSEHKRRARLVIVGDGPLRETLEREITIAGLHGMIWLAGARDDVPALMQSMDCFVLPSQAEGISNTLLEAMACGLPAIATDVGGNGELVTEGETGWLVPPENPHAMAAAMERIADDAILRQTMSAAARTRVEAHFSLDIMVRNYLQVYDSALTSAGVPAPVV